MAIATEHQQQQKSSTMRFMNNHSLDDRANTITLSGGITGILSHLTMNFRLRLLIRQTEWILFDQINFMFLMHYTLFYTTLQILSY